MRKNKPLIAIGLFVLILEVIFVAKTASFYPFLFHLFFDKGVNLKQTDNKVNILLLGIGGGNHDGPNLTDTIILANLNPKDNKVTLISIPRDLWMPDLIGSVKKINGAYADGEFVKKGGGLPLAEAAVSKITGQSIDYGVRIDFSGFVKAVDVVGGLDINIDNTFDDYQYPIDGKEADSCGNSDLQIQSYASDSADQLVQDFPCRYEHIHFNKGLTHMDGKTALEYVRSRHASQEIESSDFARSKRQEKVINAFKNKILSAQTLINPSKVISLYNILSGSIDTDIKQSEFDDFIRLGEKMRGAKIQSAILDMGDDKTNRPGLLVNPESSAQYDYAWVLIPRAGSGNFTEIQKYISCEIQKGNCSIKANP